MSLSMPLPRKTIRLSKQKTDLYAVAPGVKFLRSFSTKCRASMPLRPSSDEAPEKRSGLRSMSVPGSGLSSSG